MHVNANMGNWFYGFVYWFCEQILVHMRYMPSVIFAKHILRQYRQVINKGNFDFTFALKVYIIGRRATGRWTTGRQMTGR